jgi:hypothetical protein
VPHLLIGGQLQPLTSEQTKDLEASNG